MWVEVRLFSQERRKHGHSQTNKILSWPKLSKKRHCSALFVWLLSAIEHVPLFLSDCEMFEISDRSDSCSHAAPCCECDYATVNLQAWIKLFDWSTTRQTLFMSIYLNHEESYLFRTWFATYFSRNLTSVIGKQFAFSSYSRKLDEGKGFRTVWDETRKLPRLYFTWRWLCILMYADFWPEYRQTLFTLYSVRCGEKCTPNDVSEQSKKGFSLR